MNIGYIGNIVNKQIIGIIANDEEYIMYYTDEAELKIIINCILSKESIKNHYVDDDEYEYTDKFSKQYIHAFSYSLPFPFMIMEVEYKDVDKDTIDIKQLYLSKIKELTSVEEES